MDWIVHVVPFHLSASCEVVVPSYELPTATHAVGSVHDTAERELELAPAAFGVASIVQFVPFHLSARPAVPEYPTAVHAFGEVQETLARSVEVEPTGLGVVWIVHVAPFHFSASIDDSDLVKSYPTAVHATGAVHDTPVSSTSVVPTGLGVD